MGRRDTIVYSIYNDRKILDEIALGEFFIPKRWRGNSRFVGTDITLP